jgi:RNA polymerase sigma-70 factor (ECF subfamily)
MAAMPASDIFPDTRWSVVLAAGQDAVPALAELCAAYWTPLHRVARRRGHRDAEDAVQEFLLRLLEPGALAGVRRERGRFRAFVQTAFRNFLADRHDHAHAACRDARRQAPLDGAAADSLADTAETALFDRDWAENLLELVRRDLADAADPRLLPWLLAAPDYHRLGAELGVAPGTAKVALHRLRQRWRAIVRARVADTVDRPEDVEDELRHLIACLRPV